ncbi:Rqc2 family fibronectin-binding protein [Pseudoflavonifractor phocaeensis]|uniref:Rqc2 family fibronectin-binding protein n=1 Tax=Pseudoflavonifractor phocaeensis TaxID=1870988 RepID=UPI001F43ACA5|nr:NFACT RNA binding domain-containing protein [Pseudoflavonifractor phocaeensis]MCF2596893.1 NFACT family protein [Pseudoflavonifractor phocaeensis]
MPLDALCLSGLVHELNTALAGGKIDKIYQPGRDEVVLAVRAPKGNVKLLLSANPSHPRPQLTEIARENPETPPMFCMLLRKHLTGARVLGLSQPHLERVVDFQLEALDELGDRVERRLVLEAMGRHANLILLDGEGRIVDCLRRVDGDMSAKRQVLPGLFYRLPPAQAKEDPTALTREEWEARLAEAPGDYRVDQWLLDTFGGLSPLICRELAHRAGGRTDVAFLELGDAGRLRLAEALERLFSDIKENSLTPTLITIENRPKDFTFLPVEQYEGGAVLTAYPTFSAMLDRFYEQRESLERVKQKGQDLIRSVTNARDRTARKIGNQERELEATRDRERLRQFGDIITSNLYAMEKGMKVLRTVDFYDPEGREVDIPLDFLLTPQQNAAKYYKEYNKAKTAEEMLTIQLEKGRRELDYLNSVLENITLAEGERDLQEIRQELTDTGYLRRQSKAKDRGKRVSSKPMEFRSTAGLRISVGKNNTQNDLLTCKQAFKSDIWFHTQKIHGSHVILWTEGGQPDLQSMNEAACLAAWFSQARESSKVPVDYTPVKYVKKPAGARPGMVVYTTYETAWVSPSEELAKRLRVK